MSKTAFLFSGQGAQKIGMGKELYDNFRCAADTFGEASEALGYDIGDMIFNGDSDTLMVTENTQPAIVTMSTAALRVLREHGVDAEVCAGLSLGEYSAHVASGSIDFADAVRVVRKRGRFMQEEVPVGVGAMAAIIGLDNDKVAECCAQAAQKGVCTPANFNCPGQVSVSGVKEAVELCCEFAKAAGAKRALVLPVSAPFHCELLRGAGEKLAKELENVNVSDMKIPVITNVTADYVAGAEDIKPLLVRQVSGSVLWEASIRRMLADGFDTFIEIGPGKTLSGFVKKTAQEEVTISNVEDMASLEKTLAALGK